MFDLISVCTELIAKKNIFDLCSFVDYLIKENRSDLLNHVVEHSDFYDLYIRQKGESIRTDGAFL